MSPRDPARGDVPRLDIESNRRAVKWTRRELAGRLLWELSRPILFRASPRIFWGWRNFVLRCFGATIGRSVHIFPSVRIAVPWKLSIGDNSAVGDGAILYNLGHIAIGRNTTISQYAHLCAGTHDHRLASFPLVKAPITVGDDAWICADAFVGPGVSIGDFTIVAARAVVIADTSAFEIVAGNPARPKGRRPMPAAE